MHRTPSFQSPTWQFYSVLYASKLFVTFRCQEFLLHLELILTVGDYEKSNATIWRAFAKIPLPLSINPRQHSKFDTK